MLRIILLALSFLALSCSKDKPAPLSPAGKTVAALANPAPPTNLRFDDPTSTSCRVRWDVSEGATDYDLNYKKVPNGRWQLEPHKGTRLYNTINELEPNTTYRWAVRAENSQGASAWVEGPQFTTQTEDDTSVATLANPAPPTNLRFDTPTSSECTVRWDASEGATDYDLNYKKVPNGRWQLEPHRGTGLYNTISELEPNTTYRWAVRAENSQGASEWIEGHQFTTQTEADNQNTFSVVVDQNSPVSVPDQALRTILEEALNKQSGATITWGDMASLERLTIENKEIVSLTGMEAATNLTELYISGGELLHHYADGSFEEEIIGKLTGIAPLASLTKLKSLSVRGHPIQNADALSQLTNLEWLSLRTHAASLPSLNNLKHLNQLHIDGPLLTAISGLQGLTSLSVLVIRVPKLTDISVMQHLTNLKTLDFSFPEVTAESLEDITPLENLMLEYVDLRGSSLSENSIKKTIPALQARGTVVHWDFPAGTFNIEFVFLGEANEFFDDLPGGIPFYWDPVRTRWEQIIQQDIPDYTLKHDFQSACGNQPIHIAAGDKIDDLRIYVTVFEHEEDGPLGKGYPHLVRDSQLPAIGCVEIAKSGWLHELVLVHEIGHVLGIGTIWDELGLLKNPGSETDYVSDTHFIGSRAIQAFNDLGGQSYRGKKVPVEQGPTPHHWRGAVMYNELMSTNASGGSAALTAITIQALADLGYEVDASQADIHSFRIYPNGNAPAGKVLADQVSNFCSLEGIPEPIYTSEIE